MPLIFRLVLGLLLLSPVSLLAQETDVVEQSFGVEFMPLRANRRISGGQGVTFRDLEMQDSLESGASGYQIGLLYESRVNKIGFTTGVRYLETGYVVADQPLFSDPETQFGDEVTARYIMIPFELNFHQNITDKDRVGFMLGAAANLHLKTIRSRTFVRDGLAEDPVDLEADPGVSFRSPVISFQAGIAFDRKLSEKWALKLQPTFQFFLQGNQQQAANQTNRNYYQLGVRVMVKRFF